MPLSIETETTIYEIEFRSIQLQITGLCNMGCAHCRAANEAKRDLPLKDAVNVIWFAHDHRADDYFDVVLSGGEPLLHKQFDDLLIAIKGFNPDRVMLTTNGYYLTQEAIDRIFDVNFKSFCVSMSLDFATEDEHDAFRSFRGAYQGTIKARKLLADAGIEYSMHMSVPPTSLDVVESVVQEVAAHGGKRASFSPVHKIGRAHNTLVSHREHLHALIAKVKELQLKYPLTLSMSDPLFDICGSYVDDKESYGGCAAGIHSFSVSANGDIYPCIMLPILVTNVCDKTPDEIARGYQTSSVMQSLVTREFGGKCGKCKYLYSCGGCRARAERELGNFLAEDPFCII